MAALVVLHLRNSDRLGGPERLILDGASRASEGVRPVLASFVRSGAPSPFLAEATRRGLATVEIPESGAYDRRILRRVREAIAASGAHVAVGHDYKADFVLRRTSTGAGIPWCALVHGYTRETARIRLFERLDRRGLRRAAAVVVVSEPLREVVLAAGVAPERVHVVENGIDVARAAGESAAGRPSRRGSLGLQDDEVLCVSVGRLSPEKGHRVLLDAWARLGTGAPRLVLVGDGASRAELEAQARRLPTGRVTFAGWQAETASWFGAADVAVLPSLSEGLPLALLEAMAAGTAVVATRVGGMPRALDEGSAGLLVPPGDATALANAVEELSDSSDGRRRFAARAKEIVTTRYDAARQARETEAVWRGAAGSGTPTR